MAFQAFRLEKEVIYDALVVSDNSSTGVALVGRTKEEQNNYNHGRYDLLPTLIFDITNMK